MKHILFILNFFFLPFFANAQASASIDPSNGSPNLPFYKIKKGGIGFSQTRDNINLRTWIGNGAFIETSTNHSLSFSTGNGATLSTLYTNGNFKIGSGFVGPEPAKLTVTGYTKLGLNAPAIKTKTFTGNTASAQNQGTSFTHGLTASKILSIKVMVNLGAAGNVAENYTTSSGYQVGVSFENTLVYVWNSPTNSVNILNKPFIVTITYEE